MTHQQNANQRSNPRQETIEVPTPLGNIVCWLPGIPEWDLYYKKLRSGDLHGARREVIQLCSENDIEELKRIFDRYPAVPEGIVTAMSAHVGDSLEDGVFEIEFAESELIAIVDGVRLKFKAPSQSDYEAAEAAKRDPSEPPGPALRAYITNCFDGDTAALQSVFQRYPGITAPIAKSLARLAGQAIRVTVKKRPSSSSAQSATDTSPRTA
jgi:hypothetical protein